MSETGWKKFWTKPHLRDPGTDPFGLGRISARDAYMLKRSRERYEQRPDKVDLNAALKCGEVGTYKSFRFISSAICNQKTPEI